MAVEPGVHHAGGQELHLDAGPGPVSVVTRYHGRGRSGAADAALELDAAAVIDHADVVVPVFEGHDDGFAGGDRARMEVGPGRDAAFDPSGFEHGGGSELHGPLRGFLLVVGDGPAAGDCIAAHAGVDAGAEVRPGLGVEARTQDDAHAGFQI